MKDNFYIFVNEQQKGPYSTNQLREMWRAGTVTSQTYVLQEGATEWVLLSTIEHKFAAPTPPISAAQATPASSHNEPHTSSRQPAKPAQSPIVTFGCLFILAMAGLAIFLTFFSGSSSTSDAPNRSTLSIPVPPTQAQFTITPARISSDIFHAAAA